MAEYNTARESQDAASSGVEPAEQQQSVTMPGKDQGVPNSEAGHGPEKHPLGRWQGLTSGE